MPSLSSASRNPSACSRVREQPPPWHKLDYKNSCFDVSIDDDIETPPLHFLPASLTPPHSSDISGCRGTKAMSVMSASIHSPCLPSPSQTANLSHCTEAQLQLKLVCCHMCVRRCKSLQKAGESGSTPVQVQLQLQKTLGN